MRLILIVGFRSGGVTSRSSVVASDCSSALTKGRVIDIMSPMVAPGSDTSSSAGVCVCTAKPGTELGADPSSRSAFAIPDGGAGRSARTRVLRGTSARSPCLSGVVAAARKPTMTAPTDATASLACKRPGSSLGVTFEETGCPMQSCPSRPGIRSWWLGVVLRLVAPAEDKSDQTRFCIRLPSAWRYKELPRRRPRR